MTDTHWWDSHDNIVTLVHYLADEGYSGHDIADVVEKPWKWTDEYMQARAALIAEGILAFGGEPEDD